MKTTIIIGLVLVTGVIHAADPVLESPAPASKLYFDAGASATTTKFSDESYGYFVGGGFQLTPIWSAEARVAHAGFNWEGPGVGDVSARFVAGSPLKAIPQLRPFIYAGAGYRLDDDHWHIDLGVGPEFKFNERVSLVGSMGLQARLNNTYNFGGDVAVRFRF